MDLSEKRKFHQDSWEFPLFMDCPMASCHDFGMMANALWLKEGESSRYYVKHSHDVMPS